MIPARLLDEILALPPEERRQLALRVLESADPIPPDIEEAQYQEVLRRARDIDEGKEKLIPWEEVEAELLRDDDLTR